MEQQLIPLTQLNLTNRFLFDEVMDDYQTHQDVLSIILERNVPLLEKNVTEKEHRVSPLARSVRMDVFAIDEYNTAYNTEMQPKKRKDLQKRSRYYQSLMDTSLLESGVPDYNLLNDSYIILIMTSDLFGYERYLYTFKPECQEVSGCILEDGATRIFLNTKGTNRDEVSKELVDFLRYVEDSTDETVASIDSECIHRIHHRVCKVRTNEQVGVKYMQAWEERIYDKEEARAEGLAEGRAEGLAEGACIQTISLVKRNLSRGMAVSDIVDFLDKDGEEIEKIADIIGRYPEADAEELYALVYPVTKE